MTCEDCVLYSWCQNQNGDTDYFDTWDDTYTNFEVEKECTGFINNELYLMHPCKIGTPVYYIEHRLSIERPQIKDTHSDSKLTQKTIHEYNIEKGTYVGKMFDENKTLKYIVLTEATQSPLMTDNLFVDKEEAEIVRGVRVRESNR
jgi:hypothetical protein